jgi:hypothetical protein
MYMSNVLPMQIWLIAILVLVGVIFVATERARTFRGFKKIEQYVIETAADFRAKVSRHGEDLVVSGNRNGIPSILRFCCSENKPALIIQCNAPVNFNLQLARKGTRFAGEGVLLRLENPRLVRFLVCCTTDEAQAKIFLGVPEVQMELEKLSWSANTLLTLSDGKIELTEPIISLDSASYVLKQCDSISILAGQCQKMPNAGQLKVDPVPKPRNTWVLRVALAVGVVLSVTIIPFRSAHVEGASPVPTWSIDGVEAGDSKIIPDARNWRLAREEDMDVSFVAWIDPHGAGALSNLPMDADGKHELNDKAYLLAAKKGNGINRVVWIADRRLAYDYVGPLMGIAKVPRDEMEHMRWSEAGTPQESPNGDGLLVVREYGTKNGASIFFLHAGVLCSGTPADYRSLSLK